MSETEQMEQKLIARIKYISWIRRTHDTREDFVDALYSHINCYGGDNTWELIGYYGNKLKGEIERLVPQ